MSSSYSSLRREQWQYATVRSDQPLRVGLLQTLFALTRTFVNLDGTWKEVNGNAEAILQHMGNEGWELVSKNSYTTPYHRLVTEWSLKRLVQANTETGNLVEADVAQILRAFARQKQLIGKNSDSQVNFRLSQAVLHTEITKVQIKIQAMGSNGIQNLCSLLHTSNLRVQMVAGVILALFPYLDNFSKGSIDKAAREIEKRSKYTTYTEDVFLLFLAFILADTGDRYWLDFTKVWMESLKETKERAYKMSTSEWKEGMMDQILIAILDTA